MELLLSGKWEETMKKLVCVFLISALCVASLTGCQAFDKTKKADENGVLTFKVGHASAETVPVAKGLAKFAELVEDKSEGKIKIEVYNNGQLGGETDYVVNTQLGTLDMGVVNQSVLSSFVTDLAVADIPYIIESYDHADRVFEGETGEYYSQEVKTLMGTEVLDIWEVGFRNLTNSKHAVNGLEDIKGLRIRTMDNKVHQEFWKTMGADPVPMSWNEAYTAMQQRAIDGQENPLSVILGNNVAEVNKELAMTEHVYSSIFFLMSKDAWDALTEEQQEIIRECAKEAGEYEREEQRRQADEAIIALEEQGMKVTTPDKQELIEASQKFRDEFGKGYEHIIEMIDAAK